MAKHSAGVAANGGRTLLRELTDAELDAACAIYLDAVAWLRETGVRQWLTAMPKARFEDRQRLAQNFGFFVDMELAAIFAIVREVSPYWQEEHDPDARCWLSTLAVAPSFRKSKLGARVVNALLEQLAARGERTVYLDCVDARGVLPAFYQELGFVVLLRKRVTYASGDSYPMVLMKRELVG